MLIEGTANDYPSKKNIRKFCLIETRIITILKENYCIL